MKHAALERFNSSDGACVHHAMHDKCWLGWTAMPIEEFLYQPDIFRPIQATTTHRGKNGPHRARLCHPWHAAALVATMPAQMYTVMICGCR